MQSRIACVLRSFELELLSLLGYAVSFEAEAGSHDALDPAQHYEYRMEHGPVPVSRENGELVFSGAILSGIHAQRFSDPGVLGLARAMWLSRK